MKTEQKTQGAACRFTPFCVMPNDWRAAQSGQSTAPLCYCETWPDSEYAARELRARGIPARTGVVSADQWGNFRHE